MVMVVGMIVEQSRCGWWVVRVVSEMVEIGHRHGG